MKKELVLLVVAISACLIFGVLADPPEQAKNKDKSVSAETDDDDSTDSDVKSKGKSNKQKLKEVVENSTCTSGTAQERAQCRKERRNEVQKAIDCSESNMSQKDCLMERKTNRWEIRMETMQEECSQNMTSACRHMINAVKECKNETPGLDRAECARDKLRLGKIVSQLVKGCQDDNQTNQSSCVQNITDRVYAYATIKLQDLADRAEMLIDAGVDESIVNEFVALVEEAIIAFGESQSLEEKKAIILEVRHAWLGLIQDAKSSI